MAITVHFGEQTRTRRKCVAVVPGGQIGKNRVLFDALARLYPVDFLAGSVDADAALVFGEAAVADGFLQRGINSFLVAAPRSERANGGVVTFSSTHSVPEVFRGQALSDPTIGTVTEIPISPRGSCVASVEGRCVWTREERGGAVSYRVGVEFPSCGSQEPPFTHFQPKRWFGLLPLLDFLRTITADSDYARPPLRAAFMFDDPNLHATRYGWIDYKELAGNARANRYHVAMAMVPLDAGFTSHRAVDIFKSNPAELSLLIHGNNHGRAEFARADEEFLTTACAQALRRIRKFEAGSGLAVDRVLVPPHGACATAAFRPMAALGFEGLSVSPGSLAHWNQNLTGMRPHLGLGVTDLFPEPLPVLPRFGFGPDARMNVRLAAFLGQPIICRGHHRDAKEGLQPLENLARDINQLGDVGWASISAILRRNYVHFLDGRVLYVRPLSRRITITVPPTTTDILIDWPLRTSQFQFGERGANGAELEVILPAGPALDPDSAARRGFPGRLYLRRALCEARDRIEPATTIFDFAGRRKRAVT